MYRATDAERADIKIPPTHTPLRRRYGRKAAELAALHWSKTVRVQRGRTCLAYTLRAISCRLRPHRRRAAIMRRKLRPHKHNLCQPEATGQQSTAVGFGLPSLALSAALLAQQLPPLTNFSGEYQETEGETGGDWREQFEMVAAICHWDDQAKLVSLVTNSAERSGLCLL